MWYDAHTNIIKSILCINSLNVINLIKFKSVNNKNVPLCLVVMSIEYLMFINCQLRENFTRGRIK